MAAILLAVSGTALAEDEAPAPRLKLPPGMARADQPQQVAALYSEEHQNRVDAARSTQQSDGPTPQEAYSQKLIAYRTQLVEEQRQRKMKELELELEREARRRAEQQARMAELEREREDRIRQHQVLHVYHEWLERQRWQQQQCCRGNHSQHAHKPCSSTVQVTASIR